MAFKRKKEVKQGAPEWMCTYSDMMSLMLCFFVLLFALSIVEEKKFMPVAGAFREAFGGTPGAYDISPIRVRAEGQILKDTQLQKKKAYGKDEVLTQLRQKFRTLNLESIIQVRGTEKGIQFTILGDALFDSDRAVIKPAAYSFLQYLGETLRDLPDNPVKFTGHTDKASPLSKKLYGDKWILSMARARAVMEYFRDYEGIEQSRASCEGYADTVPAKDESGRPIPEDPKEGLAQNRRVELTLLQTEENTPWHMITHEDEPTPTPTMEAEPI
jgi:chemotaxis protein MotB